MIITFDPGVTGAFAWWDGAAVHGVADLPIVWKAGKSVVKKELDPIALAANLAVLCARGPARFVIERVASRPGQGVAGVFSLGDSFGVIRGVAGAAARGPLEYVYPQTWKRALGLLKASDTEVMALARKLYPSCGHLLTLVSKDHGRADALLINYYVRYHL
jgi:hypothetical protein